MTGPRIWSRLSALLALTCAVLLMVGLCSPIRIARAATLPTVVLDPDWANTAYATWGSTTYQALPITQSIANQVAASLPSKCQVQASVTHQVNGVNPTPDQRNTQMSNAKVSMTLALDALTGTPWDNTSSGDPSGGGGTKAFYPQAGNSRDAALSTGVTNQVAAYTGRPIQGVNNQTYTDSTRPDPTLSPLPGVWSEAWLLYMDNNYDAPAINVTSGDYHLLVNAVGTPPRHGVHLRRAEPRDQQD
jgi:hypothetical protein